MDPTGTLGPTPRIPGATQRQNPFVRLSVAPNTVTDAARDRSGTDAAGGASIVQAREKNGTQIQYSDERDEVRS
jgi:hypothetical protein